MTLLAFYFYLQPDKKYITIFIIFILISAGFQLIPVFLFELPQVGITKAYDWLLIFCAMVILFQPLVFLRISLWKKYKYLTLFFLVLSGLFIYSIYEAGVETSVSIRVFRNYFFFISLFIFIPCNSEDFLKAFRLIIYSTTLAALFYCLQPLADQSLLNGIGSQEIVFKETGEVTRYYNLPVFIAPIIFFFFFSNKLLKLKYFNLLASINIAAIILSQHRSFFLGVISMFFLNLFMEGKIKIARIALFVALGVGGFFLVDTLLEGRFTSGFNDISNVSFKIKDIPHIQIIDLPSLSTSTFRQFHFIERLLYVLRDTKTALFGIGLATEDSRIVDKLNFTVGTSSEDRMFVPQISTGDIAWSLLILNFGIFGTIVFINLYCGFLKQFFKQRANNFLKIGMYFILFLFIVSFYGVGITQPYIFVMLMLFAAYAHVADVESKKSELIITE